MPMGFTQQFADRLRAAVNESIPFGPLDAGQIADVEVATLLFDWQISSLRGALRKNFLVGRRGSGKSAALNAQARKEPKPVLPDRTWSPSRPAYDYSISLYSWKEFPNIRSTLSEFEKSFDAPLPVEWMAEKWEAVFWLYIGREILHSTTAPDMCATAAFKALERTLRSDEVRDASIERDLRAIVLHGPNTAIAADLNEQLAPPQWETVRARTIDFLTNQKKTALVAVDSMEQYPIREPTHQATLNGLIRAVASINERARGARIIFCLPSEIYAHFFNQSSNPLKDFSSVEFLHWSAKELLQIAAFRYKLFLELHDPKTFEEVRNFDIHHPKDLARFWNTFLPTAVTNGLGLDEAPLAYIIRHTQLLPRQLLKILNEIAVRSHAKTGGWKSFPPEIIRESVTDAESIIAREVFSAFQAVYPQALNACHSTMSRLPIEIKFGELEKQWRAHAKAIMERMELPEFYQFLEMLCEIGVIGRISTAKPPSDRYIFGEFEYRQKGRLSLNDTHHVCVHPLFYGLFQIKTTRGQRTVFPLGTEIEEG